jgi:hypothetical protein
MPSWLDDRSQDASHAAVIRAAIIHAIADASNRGPFSPAPTINGGFAVRPTTSCCQSSPLEKSTWCGVQIGNRASAKSNQLMNRPLAGKSGDVLTLTMPEFCRTFDDLRENHALALNTLGKSSVSIDFTWSLTAPLRECAIIHIAPAAAIGQRKGRRPIRPKLWTIMSAVAFAPNDERHSRGDPFG